MKLRALIYTLVFSFAGIWAGDRFYASLSCLYALLAGSIVLYIFLRVARHRRGAFIALLMAFFTLFYARQIAQERDFQESLRMLSAFADTHVRVEGVMKSLYQEARKSRFGVTYRSFFAVEKIYTPRGVIGVAGTVRLIADARCAHAARGSRLVIEGSLRRLTRPRNPFEFDNAHYLRRRGVAFVFFQRAKDSCYIRAPAKNPLYSFIARAHETIAQWIMQDFSPRTRAYVMALALGERGLFEGEEKDAFVKTGTAHLLAISGLHVGFVILFAAMICTLMRMPYALYFPLIMMLLSGYCALVGMHAPVVRACLTAIFIMAGFLIKRPSSPLYLLGISALTILFFRPYDLFDAGFILSYLVFACILLVHTRVYAPHRAHNRGDIYGKVLASLRNMFAVSCAAWFGSLGVSMAFFNIIAPVGIAANIIMIPLAFIAVCAIILYMLAHVIGLAFLASIFRAATEIVIVFFSKAIHFFSAVPFSHCFVKNPGLIGVLCYYAGFAYIIADTAGRRGHAQRKTILSLALVAALALHEAFSYVPRPKIHFFSCGEGDSILCQLPSRTHVLIDTGTRECARAVVSPYLINHGVRRLDALIITHAHEDHCGGLAYIIDNFKPRLVLYNGSRKIASALNKLGVGAASAVYKKDMLTGIRDGHVEFLHPESPPSHPGGENLASLSTLIAYKGKKAVLSADVPSEIFKEIIRARDADDIFLIQYPHHGHTFTKECSIIAPVAVISGKYDATRIPPEYRSYVYTTDSRGAIDVYLDGKDVDTGTFL